VFESGPDWPFEDETKPIVPNNPLENERGAYRGRKHCDHHEIGLRNSKFPNDKTAASGHRDNKSQIDHERMPAAVSQPSKDRNTLDQDREHENCNCARKPE